jgi:protein TonB
VRRRAPWIAALLAAALLGLTATAQAGRAGSPIDAGSMVASPSEDFDTPPRLLKGKHPVYPIRRALAGQSGSAEISFVIGTDGKARDFEVLRADHDAFADHAIIAVRAWTFAPATKDGQPVAVRVAQVFQFDARR